MPALHHIDRNSDENVRLQDTFQPPLCVQSHHMWATYNKSIAYASVRIAWLL